MHTIMIINLIDCLICNSKIAWSAILYHKFMPVAEITLTKANKKYRDYQYTVIDPTLYERLEIQAAVNSTSTDKLDFFIDNIIKIIKHKEITIILYETI